MNTLFEFLKLPGFFGNISSEEAEQEIKKQTEQSYLIRFSSSTVGAFVLTMSSKKGKMIHIKIDPHPKEGFVAKYEIRQKKEGTTENKKFSNHSLKKLVDEILSDQSIKLETHPKSAFAWIFSEHNAGNYATTFYLGD